MSLLDWFENDPRLTSRERAEMRERKYEYEVELRRRQMQDQMRMQMLSPYSTSATSRASGTSISLRGIREAITSLEKPPQPDYSQISKWMNDAYEKLLEPAVDYYTGYTGYRRDDLDPEPPKAKWTSEYVAKIFNGEEDNVPELPKDTVVFKGNGFYKLGVEPNYSSAIKKEDTSDPKAHDLFWQSYRRTGKLPFTATHHE